MEHQLQAHIEQMVQVHSPEDTNILLEEPTVEILHLQEELLLEGDMVQVLIGDISQITDMAEPEAVEEEHPVIATVLETVVQQELVDVVLLQLNLRPHMVVMETEVVVERDNIILGEVEVLVAVVEKELLEVLLLVAMV
jgi:hypothetical protein